MAQGAVGNTAERAGDPEVGVADAPVDRPIFQRLDLTSPAPYPRSWYIRKVLWALAWNLLYRPSPRQLRGFRVWLVNLFGGRVARSVNLRPSSRIWHPWLLTMDENSCLADNVMIYNLGPVEIGSHTVLSQNVHLCNGTHDYLKPDLPLVRPSCRIGHGVWVCADAFIGPGVTVGDNSIVAARGVVTRDVPTGVIVGGNPAKEIKARPMPRGG